MPEAKKSPETCRICGNTQNNLAHIAKEMMFGLRDEFEYLECGSCGCLQIKEVPEDMSPYYPEQYYSFGHFDGRKFKGFIGGFRKWKYSSLINGESLRGKIVRFLTGKKDFDVFHGLNINKNSGILDVGCGNGQGFLYPLSEAGFKNILGCDPYLESEIAYPNGLRIEKTKIDEVSNTWDLITYHHAFEHVPDPIENLKCVHDLLNENGVCVIRIPTVSSYAWKHYGVNWVQLDAPRHFFVHSIESMKALAEITNLELFKVVYDSNDLQFRGSERYLKDVSLFAPEPKGFFKSIQRKIKKRGYKKSAKSLNKNNQGDQAAFFLRKKA